jgi:hypothetical protein
MNAKSLEITVNLDAEPTHARYAADPDTEGVDEGFEHKYWAYNPRQKICGHVSVLVRRALTYETVTLEWSRFVRVGGHQRITLYEGPLQPGHHTFPFEFECPDDVVAGHISSWVLQAEARNSLMSDGRSEFVEFRVELPEGTLPKVDGVEATLDERSKSARPLLTRVLLTIVAPTIVVLATPAAVFDAIELHRTGVVLLLACWLVIEVYFRLVGRFKSLIAARAIAAFDARVEQVGPYTLTLDLRLAANHVLGGVDIDLVFDQHVAHRCGYEPVSEQNFSARRELILPDPNEVGWGQNWFVRVRVNLVGRPEYEHRIPLDVRPDIEHSRSDEPQRRSELLPSPESEAPPPSPRTHRLVRAFMAVSGLWFLATFYGGLMLGGHELDDAHCQFAEDSDACLSDAFRDAENRPFKPAGYWVFGLGIGVPLCLGGAYFAREAMARAQSQQQNNQGRNLA